MEYGKSPMQIKTISDRESISNKYLEQLIAMLKASGLVRSMRGPKGGYVLARHPGEIKLSEIFSTLEGPLLTVECLDHPEICPRFTDCVTRDLWQEMQEAVLKVLEGKTLQDMVMAARKHESK